jgi:2-polyprenyl-6-methoxyphenol hydroxylase-like FAD-dependent oxidoreductase
LALSHWLGRIGATTLLFERAPHFQALRHYISLKENSVEMVRRMEALARRAAPIEEVCRRWSSLAVEFQVLSGRQAPSPSCSASVVDLALPPRRVAAK